MLARIRRTRSEVPTNLLTFVDKKLAHLSSLLTFLTCTLSMIANREEPCGFAPCRSMSLANITICTRISCSQPFTVRKVRAPDNKIRRLGRGGTARATKGIMFCVCEHCRNRFLLRTHIACRYSDYGNELTESASLGAFRRGTTSRKLFVGW
jgi:hypothetical protein